MRVRVADPVDDRFLGVPWLIIAFAFEQPFWGEWTAALAAGPPALPIRSSKPAGSLRNFSRW
jgi:hypothetical protein